MEENLVNRYFERMILIGNIKNNICHLEEKHRRGMNHILCTQGMRHPITAGSMHSAMARCSSRNA